MNEIFGWVIAGGITLVLSLFLYALLIGAHEVGDRIIHPYRRPRRRRQ